MLKNILAWKLSKCFRMCGSGFGMVLYQNVRVTDFPLKLCQSNGFPFEILFKKNYRVTDFHLKFCIKNTSLGTVHFYNVILYDI